MFKTFDSLPRKRRMVYSMVPMLTKNGWCESNYFRKSLIARRQGLLLLSWWKCTLSSASILVDAVSSIVCKSAIYWLAHSELATVLYYTVDCTSTAWEYRAYSLRAASKLLLWSIGYIDSSTWSSLLCVFAMIRICRRWRCLPIQCRKTCIANNNSKQKQNILLQYI
jgi:hypothetical protein